VNEAARDLSVVIPIRTPLAGITLIKTSDHSIENRRPIGVAGASGSSFWEGSTKFPAMSTKIPFANKSSGLFRVGSAGPPVRTHHDRLSLIAELHRPLPYHRRAPISK
jgi:hypothetical protein